MQLDLQFKSKKALASWWHIWSTTKQYYAVFL